jgi:hypothetical protein
VCHRIGGLAGREELLHLQPVCGERPAAIGGGARQQSLERNVQPDREAIRVDGGPVLGIDERAAAGGDNDMPQGQEQSENLALDRSEIRLSAAGEDLGSRASISSSMSSACQPSRRARARATVVFPAAMNPIK